MLCHISPKALQNKTNILYLQRTQDTMNVFRLAVTSRSRQEKGRPPVLLVDGVSYMYIRVKVCLGDYLSCHSQRSLVIVHTQKK